MAFAYAVLYAELPPQALRSPQLWYRNWGEAAAAESHRAQSHAPYAWSAKLPGSQVKTTSSKINRVVNKGRKALSGLVAVGNISSIPYVKHQAVVLQDGMTEFGRRYILHRDLLHFRKHRVF